MNNDHIKILRQIDSHNLIQSLMNQTIETLNDNIFFNLSYLKNQRTIELQKYFENHKIEKIFLTQRLKKLQAPADQWQADILSNNFFTNTDDFDNKLKKIQNSIVIANNNDVHENGDTSIFELFVEKSNKTIFCAWDWDNHHWLNLSCKLAAIADIYAPSHNENLYQLTRFNQTATNVIPCATVQWHSDFLNDHKHQILNGKRSDSLLGMHIPYSNFKYRLSVIQKISENCPNVGFSSLNFHDLTDLDKLNEWISHKIHLIVPVLNDIPIRLFDALSTGGIPIAPESLKGSLSSFDFHPNDISYYSASDILNIKPLLERTLMNFNQEGTVGINRRLSSAQKFHHGNERIQKIIELCHISYCK